MIKWRIVIKKIIILLVICLLFSSCTKKQQASLEIDLDKYYINNGYTTVIVDTRKNGTAVTVRLKTIEYDGCEYVITEYDRGFSIAHKGNCKYCNN